MYIAQVFTSLLLTGLVVALPAGKSIQKHTAY